MPRLWLRAAASRGGSNVTDLEYPSCSLSSRIVNKASTLFLCLLASWPSGKKLFSPLAATCGQCCHRRIRLTSTWL